MDVHFVPYGKASVSSVKAIFITFLRTFSTMSKVTYVYCFVSAPQNARGRLHLQMPTRTVGMPREYGSRLRHEIRQGSKSFGGVHLLHDGRRLRWHGFGKKRESRKD